MERASLYETFPEYSCTLGTLRARSKFIRTGGRGLERHSAFRLFVKFAVDNVIDI